jgi:hypothetical protein
MHTGPPPIYLDYFKKECVVSGVHVPDVPPKLWDIADRILLGETEAEFRFRDVCVGFCRNGRWKWNWKAMNQFEPKCSPHDPAWRRHDYVWSKVTNNIMWHPSHYEYEDVVDGWTSPCERSSHELLWLVIMLSLFVWRDGKCILLNVDLSTLF